MKKIFYIAFALLSTLSFVACSNNDSSDGPNLPNPDLPATAEGVFILNQGNYTLKIDGSLTLLDFNNGLANMNIFKNANGNRSLGASPQGAMVYGDKIYVAVYESNTIEVIDRTTFKSVKQISLSSSQGQSPRAVAARDGKVYISMYNGYVSRLDTLTLSIDMTVEVGPNPEIMAICNNKLYVPNSGGLNWQGGYNNTASVIDLSTFTVEKTFTVPVNPTKFATNGSDLFLLSMGDYVNEMSAVYRIEENGEYTKIAEATFMDVHKDKVYFINAPYWSSEFSYVAYDITTGYSADMLSDKGVDSPAAFGVDPVNGNLVITSYKIENGYTNYTIPGYANVYDSNGKLLHTYETGVTPSFIFFNHK